eukprot:2283567-Rhodomonas_salina.2
MTDSDAFRVTVKFHRDCRGSDGLGLGLGGSRKSQAEAELEKSPRSHTPQRALARRASLCTIPTLCCPLLPLRALPFHTLPASSTLPPPPAHPFNALPSSSSLLVRRIELLVLRGLSRRVPGPLHHLLST